ncbi:MAG TPA: thioesterase family protein [Acidimicrobiales bacterium]|nr:thioesterase family protein [Acidimicrobiales bacterium]
MAVADGERERQGESGESDGPARAPAEDAVVTPSGGGDGLFVTAGDGFEPTELARGPWSPDALHGGPVAALVVRAVEGHAQADGLQVARLTLELLRPVPFAVLTARTRTMRDGRRVQLVDVSVEAEGRPVVTARLLRMRRLSPDVAVRSAVLEDSPPAPPSEGILAPPLLVAPGVGERAFHSHGVEMRFVGGRMAEPGPATVWIRLRVPVVAGEEPTPLQRVAAAADFGNGVSSELDFRSYLFINPDLSLHVHRPPVGEWVCLDARTRFGTPGIGTAEAALWDEEGRIGRSVQSLVVEAAGAAGGG